MRGAEGSGDCRDAVHRLYHYLDGELDDARRQMIKQHLDACVTCDEAFGFEAELRQVIARKCRDRVPEQLRMRIALAIQQEFPSEERGAGGMPPL